ncbi:DUF1461 domain-containing protein [Candidatus Woesearchaeota archaeon]|nr:DUF1461 domain-containing protein [Candidatus Woesearchaeota archaeon]
MNGRIVARCLFCAAAVLLAVAVFLSNFAVVLSSPGYLNSLARSTSAWESAYPAIGSQDVAGSIAADAISYVIGKSAAMAFSTYFRAEEISHLADVKRKVALFHLFLYFLALAAVAAFLAVFARARNLRKSIALAGRILFVSGALTAASSVVLFFLSLNFGASFTGFHMVLFGSSQWQFPSDYLLVNLFTADFFAGIAMAVVATAFVEGLILMLAPVIIGKFYNPRAIIVKA